MTIKRKSASALSCLAILGLALTKGAAPASAADGCLNLGAPSLAASTAPLAMAAQALDPEREARYVLANNTCVNLAPRDLPNLVGDLVSSYRVVSLLAAQGSELGTYAANAATTAQNAAALPWFLAPKSWQKKSFQAGHSPAELLASTAYCFDVAAMVQGLVANVLKDKTVLAAYEDAIAMQERLTTEIHAREILDLVPIGSSDAADRAEQSLRDDREILVKLVDQQEKTLTTYLGPDWKPAPAPAVDQTAYRGRTDVIWAALARSTELETVNKLIQVARDQKPDASTASAWLMPSPFDNPMAFAPPLPPAGPGLIKSLLDASRQIQADLANRAGQAAKELSTSWLELDSASQARAISEKALEAAYSSFDAGTNLTDASPSQLSVSNLLAARITEADRKAALEIARDKLDRLLATGPYAKYLTPNLTN